MTDRRTRSLTRLAASALATGVLAAGLAGCAGCDGGSADGLRGEVAVDGSSTVFPLAEAVGEEFMRDHPAVRVTIGVSGTGGGFGRFVRGETDVSNASRAIKPDEIEPAAAAGIGFVELPVAYDGLAVVVHPSNTWATCLSVAELKRIWEPGSRLDSWAEVRPGFPDEPLVLYGPGTDSGTYDYFTEAVIGESGASRTDFSASEDDNVLVQGVAGDRGSLGFFGLAYYTANAATLRLVGVDSTTAGPPAPRRCVLPTVQTVGDGSYVPLARPEFIYVRTTSLNRPAVARFAEAFLTFAPALAEEVGMVPLLPETYALVRARLDARTEGSVFQDVRPGTSVGTVLGGAPPGRAPAAPAARTP